ncbi:hypothetical protein [Caballeronia sordidicola]|jgi:hypothetical protein|uniref:Uncharacterized protein n=1 Tax=Caballeronia sordidicola TaxID=196367 RepID=A0A242N8R0_CABSO|nr:hypothetical protein [Caballeronia sordidicola]OTP80031.1 hypothetical protein PAMC26510_04465 [Caballeronia sordidicola]
MAQNTKQRSLVLTYSRDTDAINIHSVSTGAVAAVTATALLTPVFLGEHAHALNDEFARRLGAGLLAMLAVTNPELKPFISTTASPMP